MSRVSLCLSLYTSVCLCLCLSMSVYLSLSPYLYISVSLFVSLAVSMCPIDRRPCAKAYEIASSEERQLLLLLQNIITLFLIAEHRRNFVVIHLHSHSDIAPHMCIYIGPTCTVEHICLYIYIYMYIYIYRER